MWDTYDGRQRIGSVLSGATALGFILMAALHATGFDAVSAEAEQAPEMLRLFAPTLWLAYALALALLGLIAGIVAFRPDPPGRFVLACVALFPLGSAGLQVAFIGLIPHTLILVAVGVLAVVTAVVLPGQDPYEG